jgi:hypothetical protein
MIIRLINNSIIIIIIIIFVMPGSNTHNNGQPAGDGQAGDAGQGTGGRVPVS